MKWNLFRTKSVHELSESMDSGPNKLTRVLGAKELVALGIGAIIGAGIFSTLGTAAAGEAGVREGAGPALVISFLLLGGVCTLAGMCYAELTAMIPISGSAYTYAFATLGEFVAWIIGWDLILEYAVGNVAVAIAWSGYFMSVFDVLRDWAHQHLDWHIGAIPYWLSHSYGDVMQQLRAATAGGSLDRVAELQGHIDAAPHLGGKAVLINVPAFAIVMFVTWLLVRGVRESARANNVMVVIKLAVLALFLGVGAFHVNPDNWHPFAPNGWTGIHQGAAIVFFAFIGFDAISTAAEETKNPQRNMPIGILVSLGVCTLLYMLVGLVATGLVPYQQLAEGSDPLARALAGAGLPWVQFVLSVGAVISMTAVLLVFQLGQPRIFFAMARDGLLPAGFAKVHAKYRTPHVTTIVTGLVVGVGSMLMDDDATYDLTNIGTLFAFAIVALGVLVLRVKNPEIPRPFKVPFVWLVAPAAIAACIYVMKGLPAMAWERFGIWLAIGLAIYVLRKLTMKSSVTPAR